MNGITIITMNNKESERVIKHAIELGCTWPNESTRIDEDDITKRIFRITSEGIIYWGSIEIEKKYPSTNIVDVEFFERIKSIEFESSIL